VRFSSFLCFNKKKIVRLIYWTIKLEEIFWSFHLMFLDFIKTSSSSSSSSVENSSLTIIFFEGLEIGYIYWAL
jgi:hypothetical protein